MSDAVSRTIHIKADTVIASVYHFLTEEYLFFKTNNDENCDLSPLINIKKRTANATGVSESTVEEVLEKERRTKEAKAQSLNNIALGVQPSKRKKKIKTLKPEKIPNEDIDD